MKNGYWITLKSKDIEWNPANQRHAAISMAIKFCYASDRTKGYSSMSSCHRSKPLQQVTKATAVAREVIQKCP